MPPQLKNGVCVSISPSKMALWSLPWLLALAFVLSAQVSHAQIKRPGSHVRYDLELEPHGVLFWDSVEGFDEGIGAGMRLSVPLFHNGPIPKINNNLAISGGMDLAFFSERCHRVRSYYVGGRNDCTMTLLWFPVAAQWNFYLLPEIAVFGEIGFALSYARVSANCDLDVHPDCGTTYDDLSFANPIFTPGVKFIMSDSIALTGRVGFPFFTFGASFFL